MATSSSSCCQSLSACNCFWCVSIVCSSQLAHVAAFIGRLVTPSQASQLVNAARCKLLQFRATAGYEQLTPAPSQRLPRQNLERCEPEAPDVAQIKCQSQTKEGVASALYHTVGGGNSTILSIKIFSSGSACCSAHASLTSRVGPTPLTH
jgi:hypothetical protein